MAHAVTNQGQFARRQRDDHHRGRHPHGDRLAGKLSGKVALIAGGDSGIGRAVAIAFAGAGADVAIIYLNDHRRAEEARQAILQQNVRCDLLAGEVASEGFCRNAVKRVMAARGHLDVLVNNPAERGGGTFGTNLLGMFCLTRAAIPYLSLGGVIINTTAVTAWRDDAHLIDDVATTGRIISFTRSIARTLVDRRIRVNAVTPGSAGLLPIRAGFRSAAQAPTATAFDVIAPSYVLLAGQSGPFMTGQVVHSEVGETAA
jgi:NAD(P)-dependent dehydrogenase (short-subunit alcohol dehydrogenase family)